MGSEGGGAGDMEEVEVVFDDGYFGGGEGGLGV